MDLSDWLDKLTTLHSQAIDLGLDRILLVANKLNVTKFRCPVITIGGTNGKGSCVRFLETIYQAQGYKVGAYTSPHLLAFNERIRVNDEISSDLDLIASFEEVEAVRGDISLTFFEFTTLAALCLFQKSNLDVLLLEVGLGGRLDAVNIVTSNLAIITSISLDHTDWLGTTLAQIAREKAGIFRENGQAVIGEPTPPKSLLTYAQQLNTQLYCMGRDFDYQTSSEAWQWYSPLVNWTQLPLPILPVQNAATTLMAMTLLSSLLPVDRAAIEQGLSRAMMPGRMQIIDAPVPCILDVAHNPASAKLLSEQCQAMLPKGRLFAVVGMLEDKDMLNTLLPLQSLVSSWYVGGLDVPRGASGAKLSAVLRGIDKLECYTYDDVRTAFRAAAQAANQDDCILVYGSFYTVAEVLNCLKTDLF